MHGFVWCGRKDSNLNKLRTPKDTSRQNGTNFNIYNEVSMIAEHENGHPDGHPFFYSLRITPA